MSGPGLAVVTGASSGIGAAIARQLNAAGSPVLALARRADRLADLALAPGRGVAVDVRDQRAVAAAIAAAVVDFGPVDLLVNNAGTMPLGDLATQDSGEWRETFDVNVLAPMQVAQLVLTGMLEQRRGTIMMITSIGAREVFAHHGAYCASKHALHAFTTALRDEVAPAGIRVIEIAPGQVATDLVDSTRSPELRAAYLAGRGPLLTPDDVALVVRQTYEQPPGVCVREVQIVPGCATPERG